MTNHITAPYTFSFLLNLYTTLLKNILLKTLYRYLNSGVLKNNNIVITFGTSTQTIHLNIKLINTFEILIILHNSTAINIYVNPNTIYLK